MQPAKCCEKWSASVSHSVASDSLRPHIACQGPLCMGFSRREHWSGRPFASPGDLPDPGIKPRSPTLQVDSLPSEPPGKRSVLGSREIKRERAAGGAWRHLCLGGTSVSCYPNSTASVTSALTSLFSPQTPRLALSPSLFPVAPLLRDVENGEWKLTWKLGRTNQMLGRQAIGMVPWLQKHLPRMHWPLSGINRKHLRGSQLWPGPQRIEWNIPGRLDGNGVPSMVST